MPKINMPTLDAMSEMLSESGYEGGDVSKLLDKMKLVSGSRGLSGYMMWLNENRERIRCEYFGDVELKGREKVTKIAKKGGELWGKMSEEDKCEWNGKARESRGSGVVKAKKEVWTYSCTVEEDEEVPKDMSGPFVGYALVGKTRVGYGRGKGSFCKFSEALKAAREVEGCVGVTKGEGGYQLRSQERFVKITKEYFRDHVKSWVFGEKNIEELIETKKERGKKKVTKILKKVEDDYEKKKKGETEKKEMEVLKKKKEEEMKAKKKEEEMKAKKKEEKMRELKKKMAELEEEEDDVEEESEIENNDEESEDEEFEAETWIFNEEEYLVDPSTNEVYNLEQEIIGKRVEKEGHLILIKNE